MYARKQLIEKSRMCHNHKPQPIPKRKRRMTNVSVCKINKQIHEKNIDTALSSTNEVITMLKELNIKHDNKEQEDKTQRETPSSKNHKASQSKNNSRTTSLEQHKLPGVVNALLLSTNLHVSLNTQIYKTFDSHNGSLTQSMHHSANTEIKLITMMKQSRVYLANATKTTSQRKPPAEPRWA